MLSAFTVLAEPNRRAILSLLLASEQSVGEIERQLGLPQPAVSKHLRVLREAGFVDATVDAQRRLYRLRPEPLQQIEEWLAPFRRYWSTHVDALERHLDRLHPSPSTTRTSMSPTANARTTAQTKTKTIQKKKTTSGATAGTRGRDWRTETLGRIRALITQADPHAIEEIKWGNVPTWSHEGIICTGETYKNAVKLTFAKGASLPDPARLFNSSLGGSTRRAIDFHEGEAINEKALKTLIRAAVELNRRAKK